MVIISVDLGKARTGLAISDAMGFLASPLDMIEEKSPKNLLEKVAQVVQREKAGLVVVGLPKNMDGSEGESAQNAREFAQSLSEKTGVKTVMQDERGTTITAHGYLSQRDVKGKKRKAKVDTVAAAIILQNYLDSNR
ncbi:MAG: Holliday junction resolvase RuvX [Ruminococcaceae bacterium]|nr:Holliday junction resolvase RuvX [Oscillospiraceae bacterium]